MKNNFKRALSTLLVSIMLFALLPLSAFAAKVNYNELDFSKVLTDGSTDTTFIAGSTPYVSLQKPINFSGHALAYTVELEANFDYTFSMHVENYTGENASTFFFALLQNDLSGDATTDFVTSYYTNLYGSGTFHFRFLAPESGTYKLMAWGSITDENAQQVYGEDTNKIDVSFNKEIPQVVKIASSDDLLKFQNDVKNNLYSNYCITLDFQADIDMTNIKWDSIIAKDKKITVIGNYRYIKGLSDPLFDIINVLIAENLGITVNFNFDDPTAKYRNKSPFFGQATQCKISNCHTSGAITANANSCECISGFISEIDTMKLENCSSNVDINLKVDKYATYIGGMACYNYRNSTFKNCHSKSNITLSGGSGRVYNIGGFTGFIGFNNSFENCSATGSITASGFQTLTSSKNFGGFIGKFQEDNRFTNCVADVDISASNYNNVGGFAGHTENDNSIFKNCYSLGNVEGYENVGGFFGETQYENAFYNCYATGNVKGNEYVGGFLGYSKFSCTFLACYASGMVSTDNKNATSIGSFMGYMQYISSFNSCWVQESDLNLVGTFETGQTVGDVSKSNFGDDARNEIVVDDMNKVVDDSQDPELLNWVTVPNSTPTFILPKIDSPKKPCIHTYDGILDGWDDEHHWELCENENCPYADEPYNSANHTFETVSDTADCENDGVLTKKCTDCNHTVETDSFAKGHTDENGDSVCDICGYVEYILGDVNADGKVDADDYILLKRVYFGMAKLENLDNPDTALVRSDVHGADSKITGDDYILLKRVYFGMAKLG